MPQGSSVPEDLLGRVDDADVRIGRTKRAELLGVLDKHVGVDDGFVAVALIPAVHPGQHHLDAVIAAFEELLAAQGRQVDRLRTYG